jgi:PleD family two-component response regulator
VGHNADCRVQNNHDSKYVGSKEVSPVVRTDDRPRILVAEDDDEMRRLLAKVLCADGCTAVECRDGGDSRQYA